MSWTDNGGMYVPEQDYYCQMGPPPPMAQPATLSPTSPSMMYSQQGLQQGMMQAQHPPHSPQLASPPRSGNLTVLPPQSPYGSPIDNQSHPGTPMESVGTFSPCSSDTMSPTNPATGYNNGISQQRSPQMPDSTNNYAESEKDYKDKQKGNGYRGKGQPYIPSYMDLSHGPEPCVVCGDAATGYHYRCMTCEGCKGFFRRTIQKNLQYHCKWNNNCIIDKTTRNQCQYCRFQKCVAVGMATDLVLNERQRVAKRKLIEDNRERRREEVRSVPEHEECNHDNMTEEDRRLIGDIMAAYDHTAVKITKTYTIPERTSVPDKMDATDPDVWQQLAEVMTPSIVKVVEFAKRVPGFLQLNVEDQILLLKCCCMEIMCLRAACRYNPQNDTLTLQNGLILTKSQLGAGGGLGLLMEPIFDFAIGLAKLKLDQTEIALLAAVLLMQSDRTGLKEADPVEKHQDQILGAYKRYIAEQRPTQPVHWAKILMKVTDLRTISTRHAERVLCIKLDSPGELPPLFLEMFDEGGTPGLPSKPPMPLSQSLEQKYDRSRPTSVPSSFLPAALAANVNPFTVLTEKTAHLSSAYSVKQLPLVIPTPPGSSGYESRPSSVVSLSSNSSQSSSFSKGCDVTSDNSNDGIHSP